MRRLSVFLALVFIYISSGCSDQETTTVRSVEIENEIQSPPATAIEVLYEQNLVEGAAWSVLTLAPPQFDPADEESLYDIYAITFLWGSFIDSSVISLPSTDWSGKLTSSVGAKAGVRTTIDFEPGEDSLLPATDFSMVQWISSTNGDFDGLSVLIYVRKDNVTTVIPELFFESAAIKRSWPFHDLKRLVAFYPVSNTSGLVIHSRQLYPPFCPQGLMRGKWIKADAFSDVGVFEGIWFHESGVPLGYINGRFWTTNSMGEKVLEGSVSGIHTDQVIALLKGIWYYDDNRLCPICGAGHGGFSGIVETVNSVKIGKFRGEFGDWSLPPNDLVMPFAGEWILECPNIRTDRTMADE